MRRSIRIALLMAVTLMVLAGAASAASAATFVRAWGTSGTGPGEFDAPFGVAVGPGGDVYVADTQNNRIQRFSADGAFLTSWGSWGLGDGEFNHPEGISIAPNGFVYVADTGNDRIEVFTAGGRFLRTWGSHGSDRGQFNMPSGVAVSFWGGQDVYVADSQNNRIQRFESDGTFKGKWGSRGSGLGQFDDPQGVGVDGWGDVYVADTQNHRIQKFDPDGGLRTAWDLKKPDRGLYPFPVGVASRPFPSDVHVNRDVYVADIANSRILGFDPMGSFLEAWGTTGSGDGQFQNPRGLGMAANGDLYVADTYNDRIEKFTLGSPGGGGAVTVPDATKRDKIHPDRLLFVSGAGGFVKLTDLKPWHRWGHPRTRAAGVERYNDCKPGCSAGHTYRTHAHVRLSHVRTCDGNRVYGRIRIEPATPRAPVRSGRITCGGNVLPRR